MMGNSMISILLGLRSRIEGFSTETTGFIMSGFFVGMLFGALFTVRIVSGVGHIRSFAAFASIPSSQVCGSMKGSQVFIMLDLIIP